MLKSFHPVSGAPVLQGSHNERSSIIIRCVCVLCCAAAHLPLAPAVIYIPP